MKKYVLIGGGEVGRGNTSYETDLIDKAVVKLTNKDKPNFLFIGLASSFSDSYYDTMKKIYTNLGCNCQYLKKKNILNNRNIVEEKISNSDIIYFCGGNTVKLINDLENYEITDLLKDKTKEDVVFVGASAGAIMLSKKGLSDSKINDNDDSYHFLDGLAFLDIAICPHYENRKAELKKALVNTSLQVYGLENNTALVIDNDKITYLKSQDKASIYYCYYKDSKYIEEKLY